MKVKVLWDVEWESVIDEEDYDTPFDILEDLQMHNDVLLMHCELRLWDGKHYGWFASRSMDELKHTVKGPFSSVEVVIDPEDDVIYSSEGRVPYKKGDVLFHQSHHVKNTTVRNFSGISYSTARKLSGVKMKIYEVTLRYETKVMISGENKLEALTAAMHQPLDINNLTPLNDSKTNEDVKYLGSKESEDSKSYMMKGRVSFEL